MSRTSSLGARLRLWRPPSGTIGLVSLGQSGFAIRGQADLILVDPFLSPRPDRLVAPADIPAHFTGLTAVLATHEHADHLDLAAWPSLAGGSPEATFVVPDPLIELVADAGVSRDQLIGVRPGICIVGGQHEIVPVRSCHAVRIEDGYSTGPSDHRTAPRFVGYVITVDDVRVYHAGDTVRYDGQVEEVRALAPDVALLPINGRDIEREARGIVGNMSPTEAAGLARDLGVALTIPMHYELIRGNLGQPDEFVEAMQRLDPDCELAILGRSGGLVWPTREQHWRTA